MFCSFALIGNLFIKRFQLSELVSFGNSGNEKIIAFPWPIIIGGKCIECILHIMGLFKSFHLLWRIRFKKRIGILLIVPDLVPRIKNI